MECPTPLRLRLDPSKRTKFTEVPCGRCGACMSNRRNAWTFRLVQELKSSHNAAFITLTYSDETLPIHINEETGEIQHPLVKRDLQLFMKKIRFAQSQLTDIKIRFYAVGEYGTRTNRPHYHVLLFNFHEQIRKDLEKHWENGHVHVGYITDASIHYCTKYHVNRRYDKNLHQQEFTQMSTRPGIGAEYINRVGKWHTENKYNFVINNGYKQTLPRYYKDRIFNDEQKINLQMDSIVHRLDSIKHTYEVLKKLGVTDPDEYLHNSRFQEAKLVKHKTDNSKDLF